MLACERAVCDKSGGDKSVFDFVCFFTVGGVRAKRGIVRL